MAGGGKPRTNLSRSSRRGSRYITTAAALPTNSLCFFFFAFLSQGTPGNIGLFGVGPATSKGTWPSGTGQRTPAASWGSTLHHNALFLLLKTHGNEVIVLLCILGILFWGVFFFNYSFY